MTPPDRKDPPTVAQVIERLRQLPPDARCYVRPKYHGSMTYVDEAPLRCNGIGITEPQGKPSQVTFLF